jgi:hypothetical protein
MTKLKKTIIQKVQKKIKNQKNKDWYQNTKNNKDKPTFLNGGERKEEEKNIHRR